MSSFFGFAKKAATKPLDQYSVDELLAELARRGLAVSVAGGNSSSATSTTDANAKVFNVLTAIDEWAKAARHRNDKDRTLNQEWSTFYSYDWARTPPGHCTDANKSIRVGLSEYSKYEDPESAQILVVSHFDTERPGNYEKRNSWNQAPPVWAIAFSAEEMKALTATVVAKSVTEGTLIHREPEGDFDAATEPWYSETHWLVEGGKITGLRLVAKCTQDKTPRVQLIRFKLRGSTFELVGKETLPLPASSLPSGTLKLPDAQPDVLPLALPAPATADESAEVTTVGSGNNTSDAGEGTSALQLRFVSGTTTTRNFDESSTKELSQRITTPTIAITNPTDKQIAITAFWVEFLQPDSTWVRAKESRVGVPTTGYYGRTEIHFVSAQTFEVGEHQSLEVALDGTWTVPRADHGPAYPSRPYSERIHPAFPDPLKARAVVQDDAGNTKSIPFQRKNEPLEHVWTSYEDALAACSAQEGAGWGPDYQPELWLCVENPLDLNKCIIAVTTLRDQPHHWFVRVQSDRRDIGGSYNQPDAPHFQRLGFKASLLSDKPVEIDAEVGSAPFCSVTGLVDYSTNAVYALHAVIHIVDDGGNTLVRKEGFVRLDYTRVVPQEDN